MNLQEVRPDELLFTQRRGRSEIKRLLFWANWMWWLLPAVTAASFALLGAVTLGAALDTAAWLELWGWAGWLTAAVYGVYVIVAGFGYWSNLNARFWWLLTPYILLVAVDYGSAQWLSPLSHILALAAKAIILSVCLLWLLAIFQSWLNRWRVKIKSK